MTVRVSIYYWQDWYPWDGRESTAPQIPAPMTFDSYSHKADPALQTISERH